MKLLFCYKATAPVLEWESGYIDVMKNASETLSETNMSIYYEGGRSFGDISAKSIFQDIEKLVIGILLMFIFVQLVLPKKYNLVEMKVRTCQETSRPIFSVANLGES